MASRTFLEDAIRGRFLGLPNVCAVRARATGLAYREDDVRGARLEGNGVPEMLPADLAVDAMGGPEAAGLACGGRLDRSAPRRLLVALNYLSALFKRAQRPEERPLTRSVVRYAPSYAADGAVGAIENDQWIVTLGHTTTSVPAGLRCLPGRVRGQRQAMEQILHHGEPAQDSHHVNRGHPAR